MYRPKGPSNLQRLSPIHRAEAIAHVFRYSNGVLTRELMKNAAAVTKSDETQRPAEGASGSLLPQSVTPGAEPHEKSRISFSQLGHKFSLAPAGAEACRKNHEIIGG